MEQKITPQQEELDLGKLFTLIGNGFKNMFKAIAVFFQKLFHYLILIIIFFKNHSIKLITAIVIGGIVGYLLDLDKTPKYRSSMIVETNFGSGHRLYNQIEYINNLIGKRDTVAIGKIFDLPPTKTSKLRNIIIEPYEPEKNLKQEYDYYIKHTDTIFTFARDFTIEDFAERMSEPDNRKHKITVISKDYTSFINMGKGIISLAESNYYKNKFNIKKAELNERKRILEEDLRQIDSLRNTYKKVAILNAKKEGEPSTSIDLSGKRRIANPDIDLFKQREKLLIQMKELNIDILRYNSIINIISNFNKGKEMDSISRQNWFLGSVLFFTLTLLVILLFKINKYLADYENKIN